ncbi:photosynthetic complex assembly protein PuhC [Rhodobacteraceae bacterium]|nr:photosynthetic complex assembly protein PuhC [Paracoccaceae bacterium]
MTITNSLANQMKHRDRDMVPAVLVKAMFSLMFAAVLLVGYARLTDRPVIAVAPHSDVVREVTITLIGDRSTGVQVFGADGGKLAHSTDDKAGFIDVIWVSVMRERLLNDIPSEEPLRIVRRANGHTAVIDDTTGWKIELIGYGQDNVAAFAKLID